MSAARNPLRWLERKLFTFYGPADVRDPESHRDDPTPSATGPETVVGETVHREPGALGGSGSTGPADPAGDDAAGEVVRGELVPPAVGPAPGTNDPDTTDTGPTDPGTGRA